MTIRTEMTCDHCGKILDQRTYVEVRSHSTFIPGYPTTHYCWTQCLLADLQATFERIKREDAGE